MLSLAQPINSTAAATLTSNAAWTTRIDPASATWLTVSPPADTGNATLTAKAASANTTDAPRTASIVVTTGTLIRTLIATQAATTATGLAPAGATLPIGATLTFLFTGTVSGISYAYAATASTDIPTAVAASATFHIITTGSSGYTVVAGNKLAVNDGAVAVAYEYAATGANAATLIIEDLDSVFLLKFMTATIGDFTLYTIDANGAPSDFIGIFTYTAPAYTLTLKDATAIPNGSCATGATITITANTPPSGQVFDKWTATPAVTFANATASPTTFTMPANALTITANYKDQPADNGGNTTGGGSSSGGGGGGAPSLYLLAALSALITARLRKLAS